LAVPSHSITAGLGWIRGCGSTAKQQPVGRLGAVCHAQWGLGGMARGAQSHLHEESRPQNWTAAPDGREPGIAAVAGDHKLDETNTGGGTRFTGFPYDGRQRERVLWWRPRTTSNDRQSLAAGRKGSNESR